ncbi:glutamate dehydrogenase [Winogradskyella litoriviva]|uniref:Glutamate dehydrogenase n=1 Tax=Winogradskyella litoriviva TaxID=1220182 RepID=A0ABX2E0K0_9FLAO|nr:glutamate dehydrogenase [Winogradskyella litoriviva]NRD22033.1 glutamate dehydrogenase [Winogradskyella litoriviva]
MIQNIKKIVIPFILLLSIQVGYSQLGFSHEIGIIAGPVIYQSDFGVRSDLETNVGNSGIGLGLVHYINFAYRADCNCYTTDKYFNDHFKLRSELSWNKTALSHFGKWVDPDRDSDNADRLRGHTGEAQNWDIGMQLEFFPRSIRAFAAGVNKFAPFVSLGAHYVSYRPETFTDYVSADPLNPNDIGNPDDPNNFYSGWDPGSVNDMSGSTWSIVSSVGTRYKLSVLSDFMVDLRFQYYFTDWTDGLNHQLESNKSNDWMVWLNFGYIYYLD